LFGAVLVQVFSPSASNPATKKSVAPGALTGPAPKSSAPQVIPANARSPVGPVTKPDERCNSASPYFCASTTTPSLSNSNVSRSKSSTELSSTSPNVPVPSSD
jgi:hypothetical protein